LVNASATMQCGATTDTVRVLMLGSPKRASISGVVQRPATRRRCEP
jgi:hypothetical protein